VRFPPFIYFLLPIVLRDSQARLDVGWNTSKAGSRSLRIENTTPAAA